MERYGHYVFAVDALGWAALVASQHVDRDTEMKQGGIVVLGLGAPLVHGLSGNGKVG